MSKVQEEVSIEGKGGEELIELLKEEQSRSGYLSREFMVEVARGMELAVSEVYGVASFYSFLSTKPLGRNVIRVCKSLPCFLKNSEFIVDSIREELGIKPGETTPDGRFSFELTNCIGACDRAPAMMINSDVHGDLTPGKIAGILREYQ